MHTPLKQRVRLGQSDRLTITLGDGQREVLENVAEVNRTTLAYVVRYALTQFIEEHRDHQIPLQFPRLNEMRR